MLTSGGRDLVAEFKAKQTAKAEAAARAAGELVMKPTPKSSAAHAAPVKLSRLMRLDDNHPVSMEMLQSVIDESAHHELDRVFIVQATTSFMDDILEVGDMETVQAVNTLKRAAFFDTGIQYNESPIYKLSSIPEGGVPLFFWRDTMDPPTWYCASKMFATEKEFNDRNKKGENIKIFAWATGSTSAPERMHVPYWAKKPVKDDGCVVISLWEDHLQAIERFVEERAAWDHDREKLNEELERLQESNLHMAGCLEKIIGDEQLSGEDMGKVKNMVEATNRKVKCKPMDDSKDNDDDDHGGNDEHDEGGNAEDEGGKGKGHQTRRGGWMPKMGALISAIWRHDNNEALKLCSEYYNASFTLKRIVDARLNAGSSSSRRTW